MFVAPLSCCEDDGMTKILFPLTVKISCRSDVDGPVVMKLALTCVRVPEKLTLVDKELLAFKDVAILNSVVPSFVPTTYEVI